MQGISHPYNTPQHRTGKASAFPIKAYDSATPAVYGNIFRALQGLQTDRQDELIRRHGSRYERKKGPREHLIGERKVKPLEAKCRKVKPDAAQALKFALGLIKPKPEQTVPPKPLFAAVVVRCSYCGKALPDNGDYVAMKYGYFCNTEEARRACPFVEVTPRYAKGALATA